MQQFVQAETEKAKMQVMNNVESCKIVQPDNRRELCSNSDLSNWFVAPSEDHSPFLLFSREHQQSTISEAPAL